MNISKFLPNIFLFETLSTDQTELLAASCSTRRINRGEYLFSEGQSASAFFIVVTGSVKIYKLSVEGNEQILHIHTGGDLVAEAIIYDFDTYPAYCQAVEDSVLIRISKDEFLNLLRHFPELTVKIMSAYSRRLRQLVDKIEELSLHDIKWRLAKYLYENSVKRGPERIYHLSLSKKDIAAILGTIPETLSRTFQYFKHQKILGERKNEIIILNVEKLKQFFSIY